MRISTQINYAGDMKGTVEQVAALEKAGLDVAWVAEAYGIDAVSVMGYLAARTETVQIGAGILPLYSRTPTLLAQTAAGMDYVSNGRFILGLGASGPQVIEGWHGVKYDNPLGRTRRSSRSAIRCGAASASSMSARTTPSRCPRVRAPAWASR